MSSHLSAQHSGGQRRAETLPLVADPAILYDLGQTLQVIQVGDEARLAAVGEPLPSAQACVMGTLPAITEAELGDSRFCREYGVRMAYYAGAMANGIHSEAMVTALGRQKILGIFGAGGLDIARITQAIVTLRQQLPEGPFGINLLHNPGDPAWEMACVQLCLKHQVTIVEASAYINLTPALVYYRASGLTRASNGTIARHHRIIAKVSRREVAQHFLRPAPENILKKLFDDGLINARQLELARQIPMADDITVEGDSGGHTDQGTLACIFRSVMQLRDDIERERDYGYRVRIGAAGGIGTPHAVWSAFALGAAYVVTGSVNQACTEAGTSDAVKTMLARARISDVATAPSADMFEMGAKVQVLKQGSMYPVRAQKLYALYKQYDSLAALPAHDVALLEKQIFRQSLADVWQETQAFFQRNGRQDVIDKALQQPKKQMALVFQWYLGQSSRWAIQGEAGREVDYQIWCGSAMGSMNEWLKGTPWEDPAQRRVAELAQRLMNGAARLTRIGLLALMRVECHSPAGDDAALQNQSARQPQSFPSSSGMQTEPVTKSYASRAKNILLTGATGVLGARILLEILLHTDACIYCLVRADTLAQARARLERFLAIYDPEHRCKEHLWRVIPLPGDITHPQFALGQEDYQELAKGIDCVIHCAANVSLMAPYDKIAPVNLDGTKNLIELCLLGDVPLLHSSSYSIAGSKRFHKDFTLRETDLDVGQSFDSMNYERTKFEAELAVHEAGKRGLRWVITRPGNLWGDSISGRYPLTETRVKGIYYEMVKTLVETGQTFSSQEFFDITPVDYVARASLHAILEIERFQGTTLNLTHPAPVAYDDIVNFLRQYGYRINTMDNAEYFNTLAENRLWLEGKPYRSTFTDLLALCCCYNVEMNAKASYSTQLTRQRLENAGIICAPCDREMMFRYFDYMVESEFIAAPGQQGPGAEVQEAVRNGGFLKQLYDGIRKR